VRIQAVEIFLTTLLFHGESDDMLEERSVFCHSVVK
jgi:hypothetical protein